MSFSFLFLKKKVRLELRDSDRSGSWLAAWQMRRPLPSSHGRSSSGSGSFPAVFACLKWPTVSSHPARTVPQAEPRVGQRASGGFARVWFRLFTLCVGRSSWEPQACAPLGMCCVWEETELNAQVSRKEQQLHLSWVTSRYFSVLFGIAHETEEPVIGHAGWHLLESVSMFLLCEF